jgi:hypothetical protein
MLSWENVLTSVRMKRIASILLLGILVFNWFGYRLWNAYMEGVATRQLESRMNEQSYPESELISIKIPAKHLSAYTNTTTFERVEGQIEVAGIQYRYFKCRKSLDSIELLCTPNHAVTSLRKNSNEFFKLVNDIQNKGQEKKTTSNKSFSGDYYTGHELPQIENLYCTETGTIHPYPVPAISSLSVSITKPPDKTPSI